MTRSKEATRRGLGGRVEYTGATDENGILVEPSAHDIERLGAEGTKEYKEKRERQIAEQEAKTREEDAKRRFTEAFVAAGGTKADAESAWRLHRNQRAAEVAAQVDSEALRRTRARMRSRLSWRPSANCSRNRPAPSKRRSSSSRGSWARRARD